jgi:nucleotide-binding universal stress UspA family protein
MFTKVLTANDGSRKAFKALDVAVDLAAKYAAAFHVVLVEEMEPRRNTQSAHLVSGRRLCFSGSARSRPQSAGPVEGR